MITNWIHDDITWCMETNCPMTSCYRNPVNMINKHGLHSYAVFKGTVECPISRSLDECMSGCVHAKDCFRDYEDPDEALRELEDTYCIDCMFASQEED